MGTGDKLSQNKMKINEWVCSDRNVTYGVELFGI